MSEKALQPPGMCVSKIERPYNAIDPYICMYMGKVGIWVVILLIQQESVQEMILISLTKLNAAGNDGYYKIDSSKILID